MEKAPGTDEILIPGEPEYRMEIIRQKKKIPLTEKVVDEIRKLADEFNIPFPEAV